MDHALVIDGQVQRIGLPPSARRLDTGEWVMGLATAPVELVKATGHFPIVEQRPALGVNQTYGPPAYTVRSDDVLAAYPAIAEPTEVTNERAIREQVVLALSMLQGIIDTPNLPGGTLTGVQLSNAARGNQTQVKDMARILRRLIRLVTNDFSGTD